MSIHLNLNDQEAKTAVLPIMDGGFQPILEPVMQQDAASLAQGAFKPGMTFHGAEGDNSKQNTRSRLMLKMSNTLSFLATKNNKTRVDATLPAWKSMQWQQLQKPFAVGSLLLAAVFAVFWFDLIPLDGIKPLFLEAGGTLNELIGFNIFPSNNSPSYFNGEEQPEPMSVGKTNAPPLKQGRLPGDKSSDSFNNPYWDLPNSMDEETQPLGRQWNDTDEVAYRNDLNHHHFYLRYRTVNEVVQNRLKGSEAILYAALEQPKLWLRMRAAAGLADFGKPPENYDIDQILQHQPQERIAGYFKRFIKKSTAGERFVLRSAIRFVGTKARLNILQALARQQKHIDNLYLVAATSDPAPKIQKWLGKSKVLAHISPEDLEKLKNDVNNFKLKAAAAKLQQGNDSSESDDAIEMLEEEDVLGSPDEGEMPTSQATIPSSDTNVTKGSSNESNATADAENIDPAANDNAAAVEEPALANSASDGEGALDSSSEDTEAGESESEVHPAADEGLF